MMRKFIIISIITIGMGPAALCQDFSAFVSSSKDSALIGEQFGFMLTVRSSVPLTSFVPLDDNLFPPAIEILSTTTDSSNAGDQWEYKANYTITGFDSGTYQTNAIPVLLSTSSHLDTIYAGTTVFRLISPEVDTTSAIQDLKDPIKTPFVIRELLPYAPYAAGALVIAALLFGWLYYFKRKVKGALENLPALPPYVRALEALDRIKDQKLWQKGDVKEYYDQLSDTVRTYMEEQFGIPAMESVTSDILNDFRRHSWDDDTLMDILESLLQLSDLVKFAKEDPLPSDNEMHLNNAYIFVEKTKPISQPVMPEQNNQ